MEPRTCIGSWIWDLQSQAEETKDSIRGKLSVKVSEDALHLPTLTINSQQKGAQGSFLAALGRCQVGWGKPTRQTGPQTKIISLFTLPPQKQRLPSGHKVSKMEVGTT